MGLDLSGVGKWYKDEVGDDDFDLQAFNDGEYAAESSIFDINGKTQRFSPVIGANWYYEEIANTNNDSDIVMKNVVCTNISNRASLIAQGFKAASPKRKTISLYKPLPPVPTFEKEESTAPNVAEVAFDSFLNSPIGQRVKGIPFDYMFADADEAEVTTIHDSDHDSLPEMVEDEDDAIPDDAGPSTPPRVIYRHNAHGLSPCQLLDLSHVDGPALHAREFITAGIDITTTDLNENQIIALGTNLAAPLIVDQEHEAEKAQATDAFFDSPVEESPSPYHAPLVNERPGYGDVRDGLEDFPELWPKTKPELNTIDRGEAEALASTIVDPVPEIIDPAQPAKAPHQKINPDLFGLVDRAKARQAKKAAELHNTNVVQKLPVIVDLTPDDDASETSSLSKKRRARSSFATKSTFDDGHNDDERQYLYTKKVRVTSEKEDDEVFSFARPSTYSLITQPDDNDVSVVHAVYNPALLSQLSGVKKFKGQFQGLMTSEQAERARKLNVEKVCVYVGQAQHLNNLILHKDMHVCPTFETSEYSPTSAPVDSDIGRCISYANKKTDEAAGMDRTAAEEALRREAHLECSLARLEGQAVGNYRYFQGHLTVEEYHERKMCICWQLCECSKLCTRFADMMCPCADKIETNCR